MQSIHRSVLLFSISALILRNESQAESRVQIWTAKLPRISQLEAASSFQRPWWFRAAEPESKTGFAHSAFGNLALILEVWYTIVQSVTENWQCISVHDYLARTFLDLTIGNGRAAWSPDSHTKAPDKNDLHNTCIDTDYWPLQFIEHVLRHKTDQSASCFFGPKTKCGISLEFAATKLWHTGVCAKPTLPFDSRPPCGQIVKETKQKIFAGRLVSDYVFSWGEMVLPV